MRAIVQDHTARPTCCASREIDRPAIGDHEVLSRSTPPGSTAAPAPDGRPAVPVRLWASASARPKNPVPGLDVAGTVVAVGAAVTRFAVGDEVFGISRGSFAEYAAAREDKLAHKPANLTFDQAAVVPVSGLTALQALSRRRSRRGGPARPDHRRVRRRRHLRRAARQGLRGRGHRRLQHGEDRPGRGHSAPTTSSTTPGTTSPTAPTLRPDPRHRRQLAAVTAAARPHPDRNARHRRRRRRRQLDRRIRPPAAGPRALAVRAQRLTMIAKEQQPTSTL